MYGGWNATAWVFIGPANGSSDLVVMANETQELLAQVADGVEDAALDDLALQFTEPEFDLVEPGRVSRSKMQGDVAMLGEEGIDQFGLMSRKIIRNDVDGLGGRLGRHHLGKKVDKLGAGVAGSGLADDLAAARLQGGIKRKGAVAVVFKAVALGPSGRKREDGIEPVESLDGAFFVYTKDRRVGGGLEVKANDIGRFSLKARVLAGHVTTHRMGLQTGRAPGACNGRVAGAEAAGEPTGAPVGRAVAGRMAHGFENAGLSLRALGVGCASAITRGQSRESLGEEALLPGVDGAIGARDLAPNRTKGVALGEEKNDLGTARFGDRDRPASEAPLQFFSLRWSQSNLTVRHPNP